ncbi:Leucinezipper-like transcriptional regulator 1 (LZTR-1), putative [Acanthamoeba castellanii str. Neff]|uniref:Leucinezipper-like transcriptional regulator 1 (LZTR-1), putative n=1 Tax=Acanthamoeba castellanii (strain ATCC 30010 / Neff) TaxID=1257118 RepID=L8H7B7_ACACF|nr:Leucinezipper-like transcriptional regulator 1 (LZTR-1), putative [Acanthamoeba castellanii str. Neff]ELR21035.1 Leucinezipper-like transcriptional regulator 1 (LZTR-1), putative [Acanthamoeba castellanii str. Neff]
MEGSTNQDARWQEVSLGAGAWPAPRHGHSAVVCHHSPGGGPALCVYGGFGDDGRPLDDLFLFAFLKGEWRAVKKAKATPVGRHSHTAVVWRDSMFVFGGATADPTGVPSGQLLEFNFRGLVGGEDQGRPTKASLGPLGRACRRSAAPAASAATDGEEDGASMWVFGGFTTTGVDNDLFCFHFRTKTWERVSAAGDGAVEGPSARHLHSAVVSPDGESMVVVGGFSGSGSVNFADAWSFHFGTRKWRELEVPASFAGRRGHRAAVVEPSTGGGVMVVHGGRDKAGPLADLHLFRFNSLTLLEHK